MIDQLEHLDFIFKQIVGLSDEFIFEEEVGMPSQDDDIGDIE